MKGQLSIFDFIKFDEMYDGYRVKVTKTIVTPLGYKTKLKKGSLCYFVTKHAGVVNIDFPNEYGGGSGITVFDHQLDMLFERLNRKIYPKSKEIWTGVKWIQTPNY